MPIGNLPMLAVLLCDGEAIPKDDGSRGKAVLINILLDIELAD